MRFSYRENSYFQPSTFLISILASDAYSIFHFLIHKFKVEKWTELEPLPELESSEEKIKTKCLE